MITAFVTGHSSHSSTRHSEDNGTKAMAFPLHCTMKRSLLHQIPSCIVFCKEEKREKRIGAKTTRAAVVVETYLRTALHASVAMSPLLRALL
jgi:hypothetical protein